MRVLGVKPSPMMILSLLLTATVSHAQALPQTLTANRLVVTSSSSSRACGYIAGDAKKTSVCTPDLLPIAGKQTVIDENVTCTLGIDGSGLVCKGEFYDYPISDLPPLNKVLSLALPPQATWSNNACAIDQQKDGSTKPVCWGAADLLSEIPADVKSSTAIATNGDDVCANSNDTYVHCWGTSNLPNSPYGTKNLKKIVMTSDTACSVDDYGLMCWGLNVAVPQILSLDGVVKDVDAVEGQICALTFEHEVTCWGSNRKELPLLKSPIALSHMGAQMCATDADGLKCWGGDE